MIKTMIGLFAIALALIAFYVFGVVIGALSISAANSWILGGNFSDAWQASIDRHYVTFGWYFLFSILFRFVLSNKIRKK